MLIYNLDNRYDVCMRSLSLTNRIIITVCNYVEPVSKFINNMVVINYDVIHLLTNKDLYQGYECTFSSMHATKVKI